MSRFRTINRVTYFLMKDPRSSEQIANALITSSSDSIIVPFADYPGPLSSHLLSKPFKSLTICERNEDNRLSFTNHVRTKHPDKKIFIHPDDLFDLSYQWYSEEAQQRLDYIVKENLGSSDSSNGHPYDCEHAKFLVPLLISRNEVGFLRNIYYQVCLRLGLCSRGLLHYYFIMSDRQRTYLTAKPSVNLRIYRSSTVLFNTIFNLYTLNSFDLKDCYQISLRKIQRTSEATNQAYQKVHLMKMEPKIDVLNDLGPRSLLEFRFLVTQLMHRRTRPVISTIDNWFDNANEGLNRLGIIESTRTGDLDTNQYMGLFKYLSSRRDYRQSTFVQAASCSEEHINSLS